MFRFALFAALAAFVPFSAALAQADLRQTRAQPARALEAVWSFGGPTSGEIRFRHALGSTLALRLGGWFEQGRRDDGASLREFTRFTVAPGLEWRPAMPARSRWQPFAALTASAVVQRAEQRFAGDSPSEPETRLQGGWAADVSAAQDGRLERRSWLRLGLRPLAGLDFNVCAAWYVGAELSLGPLLEWERRPEARLSPAHETGAFAASSFTVEALRPQAAMRSGFRF